MLAERKFGGVSRFLVKKKKTESIAAQPKDPNKVASQSHTRSMQVCTQCPIVSNPTVVEHGPAGESCGGPVRVRLQVQYCTALDRITNCRHEDEREDR